MSESSNRIDGLSRGRSLSPGQVDALRPYVVNLNLGQFSTDGTMTTDPADVDAIFDVHLPAFLEKSGSKPVPLVIWAHGGLVSEDTGLAIASNQIPWWLGNGAYPLHFVWESGFFDAVKQILSGRGARDIADVTIDPAGEWLARPLGSRLWTAMKTSAELGSGDNGGARYVAKRLAEFCKAHPGEISLHAAGHSAGAIFQSHFLPATKEEGVPPFDSLHLLAPALRSDAFLARLGDGVGSTFGNLTLYTLSKQTEREDNCAQIYRKSLLYLVSRAFEAEPEAPILGLEQSIRMDDNLVDLFGLKPGAAGGATVIWSPTPSDAAPNSKSSSRSHGGFDNDADTMNSIARRILGRDSIQEYPAGARSSARVIGASLRPEPPEFRVSAFAADSGYPSNDFRSGSQTATAGARKALCIGIDAYPAPYQLGGCVADMNDWAGLFAGLGFQVTTLTDGEANRDAILRNLHDLISDSTPGDILAFQYSGHGTQVPDLDGDDAEVGFNSSRDEAICPVDFDGGALIIDDELRAALAALPDGVSLTTFFDCCHSGTNTRALDTLGRVRQNAGGRKARFVTATSDLIEQYRSFRRDLPVAGNRTITAEQMRHVSVAACQDHEVAYESNGHGHFTANAMQVLNGGLGGVTNRAFTSRVTELFGAVPEQRPVLDCRKEAADQALLGGVLAPARAGVPHIAQATPGSAGSAASTAQQTAVAGLLRAVAALVETTT